MHKLGHYRIDSQLGKGAMGVVYRATDERLDRTVALKVLRLTLGDDERAEYAARLQQEAKSAARLNHPGIITMFDCGDVDGYAFLAMEYVEGKSLQMLMDSGVRLSIGRIQKVADQLFSALAYAHEHDVVHRDIKPANLMLTADGRLKITDFGIAQLPASDLTRPGALIGSPRHMAPEQIEGKKVDGRADIFSAGIVLYELLTGRKPFDGDHVASIAYKILHEPVDDIRLINPDVPEALASIVMRCLEKNPALRFQTAREARAALRAIAGKTKDEAAPQTLSAEDSGPLAVQAKPVAKAGRPVWVWLAAGACVVFGAVAIVAVQSRTEATNRTFVAAKPPSAAPIAKPGDESAVSAPAPAVSKADTAPQAPPAPAAGQTTASNTPPAAPATATNPRLLDKIVLPADRPAVADDAAHKPKPAAHLKPTKPVTTKPHETNDEAGAAQTAHAVPPATKPAPSEKKPDADSKPDNRTFFQRLIGCDKDGNCPKPVEHETHDH